MLVLNFDTLALQVKCDSGGYSSIFFYIDDLKDKKGS